MNRRTFLGSLVSGLLAAPLAAEAQQAGKVYRIGVINENVQPNPPGQGPFYDRMQSRRNSRGEQPSESAR